LKRDCYLGRESKISKQKFR